MDKYQAAAILDEIGNMLELKGENPFKVRAYYNAARTLKEMEGDLTQLVETKHLAEVPGIGPTLSQKLTELITTGHLGFYEELKAELPDGLQQMLKIGGLGPKKIKLIYDKLGISTVADLEAACKVHKISTLPGLGVKTEQNILKGIEAFARNKGLSRYDEAAAEAERVVSLLRQDPSVQRISVAGSLRRRKEVIGDIDILASAQESTALMDRFITLPGVARVLGKGETKSSVQMASGLQMDLRVVSDSAYPYALHHFTGSKEHNITMRGRALKMGIKINEYGLYKGDKLLPCADEKEFFKVLGLAYIPPELREDRGEIEAAERDELPILLTEADLKGILHVHSTWSDGKVSIREMAEACLARGYQYLGITDHSEAPIGYAGGIRAADIAAQHQEIDALNAEYAGRFFIFKGTECDILPDGKMDYSDEILARFDFVIASVHSNFKMAETEMTARVIKALSNPYVTLLGHPTGRLLLSREPYALDLDAVLQAAAANRVAVEINTNPLRLDLDWRWHQRAVELGITLAICPDAHEIGGLNDVYYGVGVARKGGLTRADILNTRTADELRTLFSNKLSH